ncbi:MAG TPA: bifunctional DNA-formamidopyrimidine glycosylase/DNA-(apurinic or apyrimidinic site) lyase [Patescibacteria group bacterium]|nr:bifunctional DNA-formamidopyrimidine glycosylase/DNA-(apurinic or apyrimidinic site) lyase [Patescibacteria group bacterium]
MPELPEIETIKLALRKHLINHKIKSIEVKIPKMFIGEKDKVIGAKVTNLKRIGKGLIIELNNNYLLVIHLKMTGQLVYRDDKTKNIKLSKKIGGDSLPSKYSHIIFYLDKNATLFYNDLRQFGFIKIVKKDELMKIPFFKEMGPEPKVGNDIFGKELTLDYFKKVTKKGNLAIKVLLMDQKRIGGIGNIYANDALFKANIDPRRKGKDLEDKEIKNLYNAILYIIGKSMKYGGSSDENFVNALGQEGAYQDHSLVYGKKGQKCPRGDGTVEKIKLGGRGTYFCPKCQK